MDSKRFDKKVIAAETKIFANQVQINDMAKIIARMAKRLVALETKFQVQSNRIEKRR